MRILVVEDDRLLNNTLCYNLNMMGYTVDAALSKQVAVNFIEKPLCQKFQGRERINSHYVEC